MGSCNTSRPRTPMSITLPALHLLLLAATAPHHPVAATTSHGETVRVWGVSGDMVELPCAPSPKVPNDPAVLVLWYRHSNTRPVYSYDAREKKFNSGTRWSGEALEGRAFFSPLSTPPSLILDPTHPHDQGGYMCRVDYRISPSTTTHINLTVAIPPGAPVLVSGGVVVVGSVGPVREGEKVEVWCRSGGGRPPPVVTWWWDGTKLPDQVTSTTTDLASGVTTVESRVVVRARRQLLGARLTCHAQTPTPRHAHTHTHRLTLQPRTASFTLNITLPPLEVNIVGPEGGVPAGATLRLVCRCVGSHPPPQLIWWRGHTHLTHVTHAVEEGGKVTTATVVMAAGRELDGTTLACTATNPLLQDSPLTRTVKLKVFYTPLVRLGLGRPLDPSRIKEGDDVFFECNIQANPQPHRILWYHNGSGVRHNAEEGVVVSGLSLAVRGVKRHHSGSYSCAATNTQGTNTSNPVHLLVQYAPVCAGGMTERTQLAGRGNPVVVWCRVEAHPTQGITWEWERQLLDGTVISVPEEKVMKEGLASSVVVTPITPGDYGELVCRAATSVGRQRYPCIVTLVPAGPPDPPINCSATHTTTTTTTTSPVITAAPALTITCLEGFDGGLPQRFLLEAWQDGEGVANMTSEFPEWVLEGLAGGEGTRVSVTALNARGRSVPLLLQVPQASARHHAPQESEDEGVDLPTLLGAAVGAGAVLLLLVVVGAVVAHHTQPHHHHHHYSPKTPHHHKVPGGGGGGGEAELMWENCNSDPDQDSASTPAYAPHPPSLASLEYVNHTQSLVDVHTQTHTPVFSPSQVHCTPMIQLNGQVVNGRSQASQVETACQASDCCSDISCESEPESVIEVIKLSPATRAKFTGMAKGYAAPAYVSVSTKEPWRGQLGVCHPSLAATSTPEMKSQPLCSQANTILPPTYRNYRGSPRTFRNKRRKLPRIHKGKVVRYSDGEGQEPQYGPSQCELQTASPSENHINKGSKQNTGSLMYCQETIPPPKPPRAFSHSSLTGNALLSPLSSTSCPSGFSLDTPSECYPITFQNEANRGKAPLAEDEVRDAYCSTPTKAHSQLNQYHQPKSGLIESAM